MLKEDAKKKYFQGYIDLDHALLKFTNEIRLSFKIQNYYPASFSTRDSVELTELATEQLT